MSKAMIAVYVIMSLICILSVIGSVLLYSAGYDIGVIIGATAGITTTFLAFSYLHEKQSKLIDELIKLGKQ